MTDSEYYSRKVFIDNNFQDIEDAILMDLQNKDPEYMELLHESSEMDLKYPFLWKALYGEGEVALTAKEHAILFEYLMMENEIQDMERKALYLCGYMDGAGHTEKT